MSAQNLSAEADQLDELMSALMTADAQLTDLRKRIQATHMEIAALRHPMSEQDRLVAAGQELAAIISATEVATNDVLNAVERIEGAAGKIRKKSDDPEIGGFVDEILNSVVAILEASNFQDITGQRITKVVRTLNFVEERVANMIKHWGDEAFLDLPAAVDVDEHEEAHLLNGPQLANQGISQSDIDALFD